MTNNNHKPILAAIDIGTNSIHMVVVKIDPSLPSFNIIATEKDTVRLGEREEKTGNLTEIAMRKSIDALKRCQDLAISLKADHLITVATSATREAPNGQTFLHRIHEELGLSVDLISGQEEARRIYLGVLSGINFNQNPHIIIDIGGGSTELILADNQQPRFLSSTKVGAVRLSKEFIKSDPINRLEYEYLKAYIRGMLERSIEQLQAGLLAGETPVMVGTSGTIETLATIIALNKQGTIPNPLHQYKVTYQEVKDTVKKLATLNYSQRCLIPGMSEKRAEIILAGAMVLRETMSMLKLNSITICERSLREGMIVDWMLTHGFIEDRLRYQAQVRERNIITIAQKYQVDFEYSERIAQFALSIFDQTKGYLHFWGSQERELLWAASILHNCGLYVSHSAHHKHSYYLIRNGELLGFTETEIEIMANIARYHRKSRPKKKHKNYAILTEEIHQKQVNQLSAILRLAVALDRRQIGAIKEVICDFNATNRELIMSLIPSNKNDDCDLELWSLNYKKDIFEEEFNLKIIAKLTTKN
jgi:exopolyphosphatase / guanosine-5'-triphosphate,3'-diphosphate pyrophosphatase